PGEFTLGMLGAAYLMLGDNDAAIEWLQKSSEKNPAYPVTYAYLVMAYALKGEDAKARAAAAESRRLDPRETLSGWRTYFASYPGAYGEYFDKRIAPAWRKAG